MGRMFSVAFTDIVVSVAQDLFGIGPATGRTARLAGFYLSQSLDLGDAAEEILSISIIRVTGTTVPGSGGASVTATPIDYIGTAAASTSTYRRNDTGLATGTLAVLMSYQWNIRAGFELWLPPEARFQGFPGDASGDPGLVVRLNLAPTDSLTMSGTIFVDEE